MKPSAITPGQLQRLQVLYKQLCARSLDYDDTREARIAWAAQLVGRTIGSYRDLSLAEAKHLIDCAMRSLGQRPNAGEWKPGPKPGMDRAERQRSGIDGRHDSHFTTEQMVRAEDLDKLQALMLQLGWNEARLETFLRSARSPLRHHKVDRILTVKHANKVIFALKAMLRERGNAA